MSAQYRSLAKLRARIRGFRERELSERIPWRRRLWAAGRWGVMLYHELLRDDVRVRAESLAFLMVFSLLPLIAGCFFLFSLFAQFGMVQDALSDGVGRFLETIPAAHRGFVQEYVLKFKDAYLSSIQEKSGSIGIFAVFILGWVGLKTFRNIENTLNVIWSSERTRSFMDQARNFVVVAVVAPLVLIAALSVPLILKRTPIGAELFERLPVLAWSLNSLMTPALVFLTFVFMYRFVPVRRVRWRSAFLGAAFATTALVMANKAVELYFRVGTQTAYGKAAVVPVIGFWIYVVWVVVILGAEVSYLYQNGRDLLYSPGWDPTLREGQGLLSVLSELLKAHRQGSNPVSFDRLRGQTELSTERLHALLDHLQARNLVLECTEGSPSPEGAYALARDVSEVSLAQLLGDFFPAASGDSPVARYWSGATKQWLEQFDATRLPDLLDESKPKKKSK